jgi:MFS family permease
MFLSSHFLRAIRLHSHKTLQVRPFPIKTFHTTPFHLQNRSTQTKNQTKQLDQSSSPIQPTPFLHDANDSPPANDTPSQTETIDKRVYSVAISSLLMGTALGTLQPVLPQLVAELNIPAGEYGFIVSVAFLARILFNIPAAYLGQRFGRKPLLIGGPIFTSISMLIMGTAKTSSELITGRFGVGVGGSLQLAGGQLYISDISNARNRARTLGPMTAAFSLGAVLGPALGGYLASYGTSAPFYVVSGLIALAAANNARLAETLPKSQRIVSSSLLEEVSSTLSQWKSLLSSTDMRAILLVSMSTWAVAAGSVYTLLPLWVTEVWKLEPSGLGTLFAIMACINVVGTQFAARIADKRGRKAAIVPACVIMSCSIALMPTIGATTLTGLLVCLTTWSCGNTLIGPAPTAYVSDISDRHTRAQALGLLRTASDVGFLLGSAGAGLLAQAFGIPATLYTLSSLLAIVTLNFSLRAKESFRSK